MEDKRLRDEMHFFIINTNKSIAELKDTSEYDYLIMKELRERIDELEDQIRKDRIIFALRDRNTFM